MHRRASVCRSSVLLSKPDALAVKRGRSALHHVCFVGCPNAQGLQNGPRWAHGPPSRVGQAWPSGRSGAACWMNPEH